MQRVLVTGGAGYIGSILVPKLLERGFHVTVVDNFMFGQDSLSAVCYHPCFELIRGDVRDRQLMQPLFKHADVIIPLAALVGAPLCDRDPLAATTINKDAVVWMAKELSRAQRIVIPISNSGYGVGETGKFCTEETPMRPVSLYGRDKVELLARVLLELGARHALVVHGSDGLDEITTTGPTHVAEVRDGALQSFTVEPEDVGLARVPLAALAGGTPEENARSMEALLSGGGERALAEVVALNAGAALWVGGRAGSLREGVAQALALLAEGAGARKLAELRAYR